VILVVLDGIVVVVVSGKLVGRRGILTAFAIYGALLVAFFCISFPLTRLAIFLERRLV
jgi:ABC-type amino acid transport system permease subunit